MEKGVAVYDNEKNTTPYNENEQPEYGTIYFPCQMTSSASCPAEQEDEFKEEYSFEGESSFSTHLSDLEIVVYDQVVQIENLEIQVDSGFQQLHQQVDEMFQQMSNHVDDRFQQVGFDTDWMR